MIEDIPIFKFALRDDLVNEKINFLPTRSEFAATGWDVRSSQLDRKDLIIRPGQYAKIPLGFKAIPPEGWWLELRPRSSSFVNKKMHCHIGVLDEHFEHQVHICFDYLPDVNSMGQDLVIKFGERIGQIIPVKRVEMKIEAISNNKYDELCKLRTTERKGGWGSTGDF